MWFFFFSMVPEELGFVSEAWFSWYTCEEEVYTNSVYRPFAIYYFLSLPPSDNSCLKFKLIILVGYVNCMKMFLFPGWFHRLHSAEVVWKSVRTVQAQVANKKDVKCFRKCASFSFLHWAIPRDPRESGHAVARWLVTMLNGIYSHFIPFALLHFCSYLQRSRQSPPCIAELPLSKHSTQEAVGKLSVSCVKQCFLPRNHILLPMWTLKKNSECFVQRRLNVLICVASE